MAVTLAPGEVAVKRVYFYEESYYFDVSIKPVMSGHQVTEWGVGVDSEINGRDEGCLGEATIAWYDHGDKEPVWRLEVFGDGIEVLRDAGLIDLLVGHQDADMATLRQALLDADWLDKTPRENPRASKEGS